MEVLELDLERPEMAEVDGFLLNSEGAEGFTVAVGVELLWVISSRKSRTD